MNVCNLARHNVHDRVCIPVHIGYLVPGTVDRTSVWWCKRKGSN